MDRLLVFSTVAVLAGVAALYVFSGQPKPSAAGARTAAVGNPSTVDDESAAAPDGPRIRRDTLVAARSAPPAPAFAKGTWINSERLTLEDLRGRVVLVDFWTFGCYNCRNTLPALKQLHESYADKGLAIVGVHTPEFGHEKKVENVRQQVAALGVLYPVVTDNDFETWNAYGVEAWPTAVVLDKRGRVRWTHVGEGAYREQEQVVRQLLEEEYEN